MNDMTNLIKSPDFFNNPSLENAIQLHAQIIEKSLIQAGAKPGKDYSILDCYALAVPFALEDYKKKS